MNTKLKFLIAPILITLAAASCLVPATRAYASTVWTDNGHAYEVVYAEGTTWTDARSVCQQNTRLARVPVGHPQRNLVNRPLALD